MARLLTINPGSTSTKLGVFSDGKLEMAKTIRHDREMEKLRDVPSQLPIRAQLVRETLQEEGVDPATMDAIVGRGGLLHPLEGGVYEINDDMIYDLYHSRYNWHSCNLGALLAAEIASQHGLKSYIADPVIVDELQPLARITGWPGCTRQSIFHALNQKAVARRYAKERQADYHDLNLIVAHMGGGVSIGAHEKGHVIDVNNALNGEGPMSPERTGSLPVISVIEICYSGQYTKTDLKNTFVGHGGLFAYLGTNDAREIDSRIEAGDEQARFILESMAYQIAKEIGSAATVLKGKVDAILLTGGIAYDRYVNDWIEERVNFIAPVHVYPGEDELTALAEAVEEALAGREPIRNYEKMAE